MVVFDDVWVGLIPLGLNALAWALGIMLT